MEKLSTSVPRHTVTPPFCRELSGLKNPPRLDRPVGPRTKQGLLIGLAPWRGSKRLSLGEGCPRFVMM